MSTAVAPDHVWPIQTTYRLEPRLLDHDTTPATPMQTGTVAFRLLDAAGVEVPSSPASGTYAFDEVINGVTYGVWYVVVAALALTSGATYTAELVATNGSSRTHTQRWTVVAAYDRPTLQPQR